MIPVVVATRIGQIVAEDLTYTIRHTSARVRNQANARIAMNWKLSVGSPQTKILIVSPNLPR